MKPEYQRKVAVERLFAWTQGGVSFSSQLYDLMCKADPANFSRLADAFPFEAEALCLWKNAPSQREFFKGFGLQ